MTPDPPSPPKQRKRKPDPFLELAKTPISTPLPSPDWQEHRLVRGTDTLSLIAKLVATPFLWVSFAISLRLIDRRNRAYRLAQHPSPTGSSWRTYLSPWRWLDPQPYQSPSDSTWRQAAAAPNQGVAARMDWCVGKKHRKIAKMEFGEAFEMRWKVMAVLGALWLLGILGLMWSARKLTQALWKGASWI